MTVAARFAFGNTRVRAMKSRLLRPEDAAALRTAAARGALSAFFQEIVGIEADDAADIFKLLLGRLVADYETVLRSYPSGTDVFLALVRLHEVENLKLAWRALTHAHPAERWLPCWRPLGRLEAIGRDGWHEAGSLRQAVALLRRTDYEEVAAAVFRRHEADPPAAELAFDRWASTRLLEAARALPPQERTARDLVLGLVRERDFEVLFRGVRSYGLAPDLVLGAAVLLPTELRYDDLRLLAEWTPEWGSLAALLPQGLLRDTSGIADRDAFRRALRSARRHACLRAFMQQPFQLGPAVAFLLLREEEVRSLTALAEAQGDAGLDDFLTDILAASMMGS